MYSNYFMGGGGQFFYNSYYVICQKTYNIYKKKASMKVYP